MLCPAALTSEIRFLGAQRFWPGNPNNKIPFFPFISSKDVFGFSLLGFLGFLEIFFGFISLSHPENAFEVSVLVTPLHIVPEWYFLEFYALLKAVPNKIAGFMILFLLGPAHLFTLG